MDRPIVLSLLAVGMLGLWWLLQPPTDPPGSPQWPWAVSRSATGQVQVFGLTLGQSRLAELRTLLGETGKLGLFVEADGTQTLEAFFEDIHLSGLRADWVATLSLSASDLANVHARGLRVSTLGPGRRKVTLAPQDRERLAEVPVARLTYLPWSRLKARDLLAHFGSPAAKLTEPGGVEHWLYPEHGLDIARDPKGQVVIQYLNRSDFNTARARLEQAVISALKDAEPTLESR